MDLRIVKIFGVEYVVNRSLWLYEIGIAGVAPGVGRFLQHEILESEDSWDKAPVS